MRALALVGACGAVMIVSSCLPPPTYSYEELDLNDDTAIDSDELAEWLDHEGVFTTWDYDADSELDQDEVNEKLFGLWDTDADVAVAVPRSE